MTLRKSWQMRYALAALLVHAVACGRPAHVDPLDRRGAHPVTKEKTMKNDENSDDDAAEHVEISGDQLKAMGRKETQIDRGTSRIVITLADVDEMSRSLSNYLQSAGASSLEDRADLISSANGVGWIDGEGVVRIGPWVLASQSDPLVLRIRMPGLETAPVVKAYVATLAHDDNWRVVSVDLERIRRR